MITLNISLPDQMREFIESRIADGNYSDASDYVYDLIREDQMRQHELNVDHLLIAGLGSGEPIEITEGYIAQKRCSLMARLASENRGRRTALNS